MAKQPLLSPSLIVTTYNWPQALSLVLESIRGQSLLPLEVIVADDGSGPETRAVVDAFRETAPFPVKHIWQEDKGFRAAAIRNRAILACQSPYVIQIDGDVVLHPAFTADHLSSSAKGCFIIGGRISLSPDQSDQLLQGDKIHSLRGFGLGQKWKMMHLPLFASLMYGYKSKDFMYGISANISCWRDDLLAVNGYDEDFEGWGREDSDLICRLMNHGLKKRYLRMKAICYHLWHNSRKQADSFDRNHILMKNNITCGRIVCSNGLEKKITKAS
ncbi:MAG: glycosyltransferase family 2 protein [Rikenellaceae bacterium]|jgi:glycosyltransferase involved in cell wall biosynthesis|nr:glycosyltransferase family 2 protein [Rikenellaceae bacterium]